MTIPIINRIRFCNLGVSRCFLIDETLDFHGGNQTLISAQNGTGKSAMISIILSHIRPFFTEFVKGDDDIKRRLKDYVLTDRPGHIICEWIIMKGSEKIFLITGMVLEKKGDQLDEHFYTFQYPLLIEPDQPTIDSIQIQEDGYILTRSEFMRKLRSRNNIYKDTYFRNTATKYEWVNILKDYAIDDQIFRFQADMNQHEGGMKAFLKYSKDSEFFEFLLDKIIDFSQQKEDLEELRKVYKHFKEINKINSEISFVDKLIELFENGKHLSQDRKSLLIELKNIVGTSENVRFFIEEKVRTDEDNKSHLEHKKSELKLNQKELLKKERELREVSNYYEFSSKTMEFKALKVSIDDLKQQLEKSNNFSIFLKVLPTIKIKGRKEQELRVLNDILEEHRPLIHSLEEARVLYEFFIIKKIHKLQKELDTIQQQEINSSQELQQINIDIGRADAEKNLKQEHVDDNDNKIIKINDKYSKIDDFQLEIENIENLNDNLIKELNDVNLERNNLKNLKKSNISKTSELNDEKEAIHKQKEESGEKYHILNSQLENINELFFDLIQNPWYTAILGEIENQTEVDYSLLDFSRFYRVEEKSNKLTQRLENVIVDKKAIEKIIKNYETYENFPYRQEVVKVFNLLSERFQNIKFMIGWEYLKTSIPLDQRDLISEKYPHLLNGVIAITNDLGEIINFIDNKRHTGDLADISDPIFLSSSAFFNNLDQISVDGKFNFLINPGLNWRFEKNLANERYETLKSNLSLLETKYSKTKEENNQLIILKKNWNEFKEKYSENYYNKTHSKIIELKHIIDTLQIRETVLNDSLKTLENDLRRYELNLNETSQKKDKLTARIATIDTILEKKNEVNSLNQENELLFIEINKINGTLESLLKNRKKAQKEIKEIKKEIQKINDKVSEYTEVKDDLSISYTSLNKDEIITEKGDSYEFVEIKDRFYSLFSQYQEKIEKTEIKNKIQTINSELKNLANKISKFQEKSSLLFSEEFFQDIIRRDLDEIEIETEIKDLNETISKLNFQIQKNYDKKDELNINISEIKDKLKRSFRKLQSNYSQNVSDKITLSENIKINNQEKKVCAEQLISLNNTLSALENEIDDIKSRVLDYKSNLISIQKTISNLNEYGIKVEKLSEITLSIKEPNIEDHIKDLKESSIRKLNSYSEIEKKANRLIERINNIEIPEELNNTNYVRFLSNFNMKDFMELNLKISQFNRTRNQLAFKKDSVFDRIEKVIEIYSFKVEEYIHQIKNLRKLKIDCPTLKHVHNQPLLRFKVKDYKLDELKDCISNYFQVLIRSNETFPRNLTFEHIVKEIFSEFIPIIFKNPEFIFLEQIEKTSYENVVSIRKTSGGELMTFTILLFCLIAYNRMKNIHQKSNIPYQIPIIMDNPLGEMSRNDFIELQIELAKKLHIQLIVFTSIEKKDLYGFFDTTISMFKDEFIRLDDGRDLDTIKFETKTGSISLKPRLKPKVTKIEQFL